MAHKVKPNRSIGEPAASPFLRVAASPFRSTHLQRGWVGEEAVALALYCFLKYPNDYAKTVIRAANTNGDSDSIACIAGSISGAYLGIDAIPSDWTSRIEKSDYLADLAMRLEAKRELRDAKQQ
jgi:ADP-ribosylglycohydrolase